jgi:hypothetical protein
MNPTPHDTASEARRQGNRLYVARSDVEALATTEGRTVSSLAAWADRARAALEAGGAAGSGRTAANLVIEDREHRSAMHEAGAGR